MKEKISSAFTAWEKWGGPIVFFLFGGLVAADPWINNYKYAEPNLWMQLGLPLGWIVGSWWILRYTLRLKEVWLDGENLIIKGYKTEEIIQLRKIEEVRGPSLLGSGAIRVMLRESNAGADYFEFYGIGKWRRPFTEDPLVTRLRECIQRARAQG
jgi:hypothetical protein